MSDPMSIEDLVAEAVADFAAYACEFISERPPVPVGLDLGAELLTILRRAAAQTTEAGADLSPLAPAPVEVAT